MSSKYFNEEKVYSNNFDDSGGRVIRRESFILKFFPDGSMSLSRNYYDSYDSDSHSYNEIIKIESSYLGEYELVSEEPDMKVISLHLTQETSKSQQTDQDCGPKEEIFYENKSVNIRFDMIERKGRERIGFSVGNVFKNYDDVSDNIYFKEYISQVMDAGLEFNETEIIEGMKKYNCSILKWLSEMFPEYKLEEKCFHLLKNHPSYNKYQRNRDVMKLFSLKGDVLKFVNDEYSWKSFKELLDILHNEGIDDLDTVFAYFGSYDNPNVSGEFFYKYYKRYELFGEQNEILKSKYGMTDENSNFYYLINYGFDLKKIFQYNNDKMNYYNDELNSLSNIPDEKKNENILKDIPFGLSSEEFNIYFEINSDDKIKQDFKNLERFNVQINKTSFEAYKKTNGDIFATSVLMNSPEYYEVYGDRINSEYLAYALKSEYCGYLSIDEFNSYLEKTSLYFNSKGVIINEEEIFKMLAYTKPKNCVTVSPNDLYYLFYLKKEYYHKKNDYMKKYAPNCQNDYENLKYLYNSSGCINNDFMGLIYDYNDENKLLKELETKYGPKKLEEINVWKYLCDYSWETCEKKRENILFIVEKLLNLDEEKRNEFLNNRSDYIDVHLIYSLFIKHEWNSYWIYLYRSYPEFYDAFKDKSVDPKELYYKAISCSGDLSKFDGDI